MHDYCNGCYYKKRICGGWACHYSIIEDRLRPSYPEKGEVCSLKLIITPEAKLEKDRLFQQRTLTIKRSVPDNFYSDYIDKRRKNLTDEGEW